MVKSSLRTPIAWFGGKTTMLDILLPLFPIHTTYVEVFGGSGACLISKPRSPVEVYNDLNSGLVNFFRVLRDPDKATKLERLCRLTPYSREEYKNWEWAFQDESARPAHDDGDVAFAHKWFVVLRQTFSSTHAWAYNVETSSRGVAGKVSAWFSSIDRLGPTASRLLEVQVENDDFRKLFKRFDTPDTFFYLDPPYILDTRKGHEYMHEMTDEDHEDLVDILLNIDGMALLSGYWHEIYAPLEDANWEVIKHSKVSTTANTRKSDNSIARSERTECIWRSPNCVSQQIGLGI